VATSRVILDEIDNLLTYLAQSEIALHVNPVVNQQGRVSWVGPSILGMFLNTREHTSIMNYRAWLSTGAYSALLFDGSLLQLTYDFEGRELVAHRLAWVPCPFRIDLELLLVESPIEVVELYAEGAANDVLLRTTIRFDYDALRARRNHPAAHLSINSAECRIACAAPLRLGHFVDFVFRHFYPDYWRAHPYLGGISRKAWGHQTVTQEEMNQLHVSWRQ
jgi:hypothetical protein